MKLTAIAIDDEVLALRDLKYQLSTLRDLNLKATFSNTADALDFLSVNGHVNMIFCDIELSEESGLDAARPLSAYTDCLIFVTGHPQYALEAYNVGADAYLMKPVNTAEVLEKMDKLRKLLKTGDLLDDAFGKFLVRDGAKKTDYAVDLKAVIKIRSNGNYVDIVTEHNRYTDHITMNKAEEIFERTGLFLRVHQSTIVAKKAISHFHGNSVYLTNLSHHPIGKTYAKKVQAFRDEIFLDNR